MSEPSSTQGERRHFRRAVVGMPVTAVRRSTSPGDPRRVLGLHVFDLSRNGVGAFCPEPLEAEEPLVLFFPPVGSGGGRDTQASVVRCGSRLEQYTVGIRFDEPWPEHEGPPRG